MEKAPPATIRDRAFGLFVQGKTYAAIAIELGVSRQRVQQIVRPPRQIYDAVCRRAGGACEDCGIELADGHVHHIETCGRTTDDFNLPENLRYLCPSCHRQAHLQNTNGERLTNPVRVTVYLEREQYEELKQLAGENVSGYIRALVRRALVQCLTAGSLGANEAAAHKDDGQPAVPVSALA